VVGLVGLPLRPAVEPALADAARGRPHAPPPAAEDTGALLAAGIGITNLVARATARADELSDDEIRAGVPRLEELVARWRPPVVAVLGVTAYRVAFSRPKAVVGRHPDTLADAVLWVLPNPSGLNAHYQQPALTAEYAALRAVLAESRQM
jgi:double-stranded uracil-DNA glycosylase